MMRIGQEHQNKRLLLQTVSSSLSGRGIVLQACSMLFSNLSLLSAACQGTDFLRLSCSFCPDVHFLSPSFPLSRLLSYLWSTCCHRYLPLPLLPRKSAVHRLFVPNEIRISTTSVHFPVSDRTNTAVASQKPGYRHGRQRLGMHKYGSKRDSSVPNPPYKHALASL